MVTTDEKGTPRVEIPNNGLLGLETVVTELDKMEDGTFRILRLMSGRNTIQVNFQSLRTAMKELEGYIGKKVKITYE